METTYHVCRALRAVSLKRRPHTAALILAGGIGSRCKTQDGKTKQLSLLLGKPMFLYSVIAFENCPYIDEIAVVCREEEAEPVRQALTAYPFKKVSHIVFGGASRQESALRGFEAVDSPKLKYIAIHDAARPLITPEEISDVVASAYAAKAAALGSPAYDTVKITTPEGFVQKTVDRDTVWLAATPQVFEANLYRAATYTAKKDKFSVTDDMMLCEHIGQTVKMVDCGIDNFKVTHETDILRAERILQDREEKTK